MTYTQAAILGIVQGLAEFLPIRGIICAVMGLTMAAALVFIGGNREAVSRIYNTED